MSSDNDEEDRYHVVEAVSNAHAFQAITPHDSALPSLDRPATPSNNRLLDQELSSRHPASPIRTDLLDARQATEGGTLFHPDWVRSDATNDISTDMVTSAPGLESDFDAEATADDLRRLRQRFEKRLDRPEADQRRLLYPVDLRALEHVSPVDPNLVCPICQCPFQNPVQLECDHSFCKDCLRQSFEINLERQRSRPCPTCRRPHSVVVERQAPRYVQRMLDDLIVMCPNHEAGCNEQLKRGDVMDHIDYYCGHQSTPCSSDECSHDVDRKDRSKPCLHYLIDCDMCSNQVLASDVDTHLEKSCPKNVAECPHCRVSVGRKDLAHHINTTCDIAPAVCPGSQYGCQRSGMRSEIMAHANHCPIATMTPFLEKQRAIQEEQRSAIEKLQRRNEIFEGSVRAMQTLIYDSPAGSALTGGTTSTQPPTEFDASLPAEAPFDTPTQHLLSLHESLRDELSRLEAALSDVDARTTMMIVNESQRNKEDMAHTNAAINGMRSQLHWLMSAQVQASQRARAGAGPGGGGNAPAAGPSSAGIPGATSAAMGPSRRLSGQETKL